MNIDKINISETLQNVETFLKEDKDVSPQVSAMMELLIVVIKLLLGKLGLNSRNSSKPPSSDPNRTRGSKKKVKEKKRKPGGQPGHKGSCIEQVKDPDRIETLEIDRRTLPPGQYKQVGYESRQVIEIEVRRQVTEYRAEILADAQGNRYVAEFPERVTRPAQYGQNVKSQSVYMSQQQLIPYDRVQDYFSAQSGIEISTGTLFNFNKEAYRRLEEFEKIAKRHLTAADVLHADETGININGKLRWLHSNSTNLWTLFFPHDKRGMEAMRDMGVLEHFRGILCHDHWWPYFKLQCEHSLCNAHIVRELERALEQDGQKWAEQMQELLLEIKKEVEKAGGSLTKKEAKKFRKRYRTILAKADKECPAPDATAVKPKRGRVKKTKPRNLLERLRNYETEVLRFMVDKRVPFTNNQGENDIRMTKVQQKISGCFRSLQGAKIFCRVRSYLSSCRKHGVQPSDALRMLFAGKLPAFVV